MEIQITIKKTREQKGLTLEHIEEEAGIEKEYLKDIESGIIPVDEILFIEMIIIANVLECKITDLFIIKEVEIR